MDEPADPVAVLQRWELSGGTWAVRRRSADRVTVSLRRCDGGEEVDRFTSERPDLLAYLGQRTDSGD